MGRTLQRSLLIVVVGTALGLAANAVSPRRIPYLTPPKVVPPVSDFIPFDEAKQLWQSSSGFFLDARSPADYAAGHIGGAYSLPAEEFDAHFPAVAPFLAPDSIIVTYCDGLVCDLSHHLTDRLRERGHKNVRILQNGWTLWHKAGLMTSTGDQP